MWFAGPVSVEVATCHLSMIFTRAMVKAFEWRTGCAAVLSPTKADFQEILFIVATKRTAPVE